MKYLLLIMGVFILGNSDAQKSRDMEAIKGQCGCFDITFKYAETFSPDISYKFHDGYVAHATEFVFVVEESKDKVVLQHLLAINDTMVVKHWREDWTYQNPHLLSFNLANDFKYTNVADKNFSRGWTQTVYGTQDEFRYAGFGEWAHINGKSVWESRSDAALPRREYSHRSDYTVMSRGNRIHITSKGYLHEQDNDKIIRKEGETDVLLASEKGFNNYIHTEMRKCQVTKDWWEKNEAFWNDVRRAYSKIENEHKSFSVKSKVDNQRLASYFYDLKEKHLDSVQNQKKLAEIFDKFIVFETSI
jgi:hypothetical protein